MGFGSNKGFTPGAAAGGGGGDVDGPAGATDNAVARYADGTGKLLQDSLVTIADNGETVIAPTAGAFDALHIDKDDASILLGDAGHIKVTHGANYTSSAGLTLARVNTGAASSMTVAISTKENTITAGEDLGSLIFISDQSGGQHKAENQPAAGITAIAENTFSANLNATSLAFKTATSASATEKMRLTHSGSLGIGETVPNSKLHVRDTDKTLTLEKSPTGFFNSFGFDGAIPYMTYYSSAGAGMKFGYGESTGGPPIATRIAMYLQNDGAVGIGTLAPTAKLNFETTSSTIMHISRDGVTGASHFDGANWALGTIGFGGQSAAGGPEAASGEDNDAVKIVAASDSAWGTLSHATYMAFSTTATGSVTATERMRINSSGNVGIGVTNPTSELTVAGQIHSYDAGGDNGDLLASTAAGVTTVWIRSSGDTILNGGPVAMGNNNPSTRLHLGSATSTGQETITLQNDRGTGSIGLVRSAEGIIPTSNPGDLVISLDSEANDILFATNTTQRMIIDSTGKVGIGTMDPPGTLLQLEGADAYLTLKNSTDEHTDGAAETRILFEDHSNTALAQIQASHDGDGNDTRGDLIFSTHDGSSLLEAFRITRRQWIGIGTVNPGGSSTGAIVDIENTIASSATEGGNLRLSSNDGAALGNAHRLGVVEFAAAENAGSAIIVGAKIEAVSAEAWDASNNGANLNFYTTSGNATQTKRMSILTSGSVELNYATAQSPGAGFNGIAGSPVIKTQKINNEITTTIIVDIGGLQLPDADGEVIGDDGEDHAYILKLDNDVNGIIYKAEIGCVETVTHVSAGEVMLVTNPGDLAQGASAVGAGSVTWIDPATAWKAGMWAQSQALQDYSTAEEDYLYLAIGTTLGGAAAYTAGKFVIKLYGASF